MIRTQVQLNEAQMQWLKKKARAEGLSISHLIRESIDSFRQNEERFPQDKKHRALAAVGCFASNASDVSERHDDYLADAFGTDDRHGE